MPSLHVAFCFSLSFPLLSSTPRHYTVHLSTCHPPIFLPLPPFFCSYHFLHLFIFLSNIHPYSFLCWMFCLLSLPSINHPPSPSLIPETRTVFSPQTNGTLSPFCLDGCQKMKLQISYEGETLHTDNHYRRIDKQESLCFFYCIYILMGNKESVLP